jgi:hypothetical protein
MTPTAEVQLLPILVIVNLGSDQIIPNSRYRRLASPLSWRLTSLVPCIVQPHERPATCVCHFRFPWSSLDILYLSIIASQTDLKLHTSCLKAMNGIMLLQRCIRSIFGYLDLALSLDALALLVPKLLTVPPQWLPCLLLPRFHLSRLISQNCELSALCSLNSIWWDSARTAPLVS